MGSFNFFINLKLDNDSLAILDDKYKTNSLYQAAFYYGKTLGDKNNGYNAGISSVIDNFIPANRLIYNFLSTIKFGNASIFIKTGGVERTFDFEKQSDFICFMYKVWEQKIISTYKQFGVILLDNNKYCKYRNKLYKKYYKKIQFD